MTVFEITITPARQTLVAIGVATFTVASEFAYFAIGPSNKGTVVGISTKWSLRAVNFITAIKVFCNLLYVLQSLLLVSQLISQHSIVITGFVVLLGGTRISDPLANFHDPWAGSTSNGNAIATALVKTHFAFVGWHNMFNVLGEVKTPDPVRTVRNAGLISLSIISFLFILTNVAYVAAVPREDIKQSGQLVAALFFERVFGRSWAAKTLPAMVACSCVGNIVRNPPNAFSVPVTYLPYRSLL